MISKEILEKASKQAVDNCLHVKKGEKAVVITDKETNHIATAIANRLEHVGAIVKFFMMEDFGERSVDGTNPLKFPEEIGKALATTDVSIYAAQGKKGELQTFRQPMLKAIEANKKLRHAHMININDEIVGGGMLADYAKIQEMTKKINDIVVKAKKIHVTTKKGTDLTAELNPNYKWAICDGNILPGTWTNLPDGEIFTTPKTVNGKAVIDGTLGDYMCEKFGPLEKNPVYVEIKDGRVTGVKCDNKEIEAEYNKYIKQEPNANRIGEFAIGTNIGLTKLVGNLLQDEKFPGVHFAVGHPYPEKTGADWDADCHLDQIITNTTIEVDGKTIMKEGKFTI